MAVNQKQLMMSRAVSALYIFAGAMKFPVIPSVHENMRKQFEVYASVFPGKVVGFNIDSEVYMYGTGGLEFFLGLGLLLGTRRVKVICTQGLMVIMTGAVYTLVRLRNFKEAAFPGFLLPTLGYLCYFFSTEEKKKTD